MNEGMGRRKKWDNEDMWAQAVEWSRGGATYREIAGRLARSSYMSQFGLEEAPGEDTVRREVKRRLASGQALAGQADLIIEFDSQRPEDLGLKTLDGKPWQVACLRGRNVGHATAKRCLAALVLESGATVIGSQGPFYLNPVDELATLQRDTANPVDITPGQHRSWDLVLAPSEGAETGGIVSSGPIYALGVPADAQGRPPEEMDWTKGGACIAIPIAIARRGVPQAHLLPGEYLARVRILDESGKKAETQFRIRAPGRGDTLEVALVNSERH